MAHSAHDAPKETRQLTLPVLVFGLPELRRLHRELEALEEFMRAAAVRMPGTQVSLPRLSRLCEALATENHLNLLQPTDRKLLEAFVVKVEHTAPHIHISFASDPSSAFTAKVVTWLRGNVHPWALLQVGLQPTLAAGCVVRSTNHIFDFSLRERFVKSQDKLLEAFEAETPKDQVPLESAMTPEVSGGPKPAPEHSPSELATSTEPQPQAQPATPPVVAETSTPTSAAQATAEVTAPAAAIPPAAPAPPEPPATAALEVPAPPIQPPHNHLDEAAAAAVAMEVASVLVPEEVTEILESDASAATPGQGVSA